MMSHAQPRPMLAQPETSTLQGLVSHLQGLRETTPSGFFQILGHSSVVFTLYIYICRYVHVCGSSQHGNLTSGALAEFLQGWVRISIYLHLHQKRPT